MTTAEEIIKLLKLQEHPVEGGYFLETYKSSHTITRENLPPGYKERVAPATHEVTKRYSSKKKSSHENKIPIHSSTDDRSFSTAIYYMLTPGTFSEMHRLKGDEIFHFYAGSPVEMLQLFPDGSGKKVIIGNNIKQEEQPQVVVPAGVWQGSRLLPGGEFALMGTTMAPGFDFSDYQTGNKEELIRRYPHFEELITHLTKRD